MRQRVSGVRGGIQEEKQKRTEKEERKNTREEEKSERRKLRRKKRIKIKRKRKKSTKKEKMGICDLYSLGLESPQAPDTELPIL